MILQSHIAFLLGNWPALGCVLVAFVSLGPRQVGAGHGGERVSADAWVLTLWRRHGHDRLGQTAAHWVCRRKQRGCEDEWCSAFVCSIIYLIIWLFIVEQIRAVFDPTFRGGDGGGQRGAATRGLLYRTAWGQGEIVALRGHATLK